MRESHQVRAVLGTSGDRPAVIVEVSTAKGGRRKLLPPSMWQGLDARLGVAREVAKLAGAAVRGECLAVPVEVVDRIGEDDALPLRLPRPFDDRMAVTLVSGIDREDLSVEVSFRSGRADVTSFDHRLGVVDLGDGNPFRVLPRISAFLDAVRGLRHRTPSASRRDAFLAALDALLDGHLPAPGKRTLFVSQVNSLDTRWEQRADGGMQWLPLPVRGDRSVFDVPAQMDAYLALVDGPAPMPCVVAWGDARLVMHEDMAADIDEVARIRALPPEARAEASARTMPDGTRAFPEQVTGYGPWVAPRVRHARPPRVADLPEWTVAVLGDLCMALPSEEAADLGRRVQEAQASGAAHVEVGGRTIPLADALAAVEGVEARVGPWRDLLDAGRDGAVPAAAFEPAEPMPEVSSSFDAIKARKGRGRPQSLSHGLRGRYNLETVEHALDRLPRTPLRSGGDPAGEISHLLRTPLAPHQAAGVAWLAAGWLSGRRGQLLCDDPGTGKTLSYLAYATWLRHVAGVRDPILLVTTNDLVESTARELAKVLTPAALGEPLIADAKVFRDAATRPPRLRLARAGIVIVTYETMVAEHVALSQVNFSVGIFDEAQRLWNPATQARYWGFMLDLDHRVCVTGTPVGNHMSDLWSLVDFAWAGRLGSFAGFMEGQYPRGALDWDALRSLSRSLLLGDGEAPLVRRVLKDDVVRGLAPKLYVTPEVTMPPVQEAVYGRVLGAAPKDSSGNPVIGIRTQLRLARVSLHPGGALREGATAAEADAWMDQSARLRDFRAVSDMVVSRNEKMIVVARSARFIAFTLTALRAKYGDRVPVTHVNHQVPKRMRMGVIDAFRATEGPAILVITHKVGGTGHTIVEANHVYHLERWWNPAWEAQAEDRVHRIGQDRQVFVYCPLAVYGPDRARSFDVRLDEVVRHKRLLSRETLMPAHTGDEAARIERLMAA